MGVETAEQQVERQAVDQRMQVVDLLVGDEPLPELPVPSGWG